MTVYVDIPMTPFTLSIEGGELQEVQKAFERLICSGGSAAFPYDDGSVFLLNLSRVPFVVCSTKRDIAEDKPLNLISIEQVRRIFSIDS